MEGFLLKKGRGESKIFGRRNWKKRWFILEGQYLTYFEDFDRENNRPTRQKGVVVVRGCKVRKFPHQGKQFCFEVKHEQRLPIYLCADTEKLMYIWIDALQKAAEGIVRGPTTINWSEYFEVLNMPPDEEYTLNSLNKAYRKAALKTHPDKGGSVDTFKKVQEAFEMLQSKYEEEEQSKNFTTITFTARIVKKPHPLGFGLLLVEDLKHGGLLIKGVYDTIVVDWIAPEAGGSVQKGDYIVEVQSDDVRSWSLARLAQRLNNFRVPVDSVVTFTFERKVRTSGEPEFQEDEFKEPKAEDNFESKEPSIIVEESMPSSRPSLRTRLSITFRETSESDEERSNNPSPFEEIIDEEPVNPPILPRYEDVDIPPKSDSIAVSEPDHSSLIASLQSEIENLRNELHKVVGQRDNLRDELDDLRMKMEVTIGERNEFLRQLGEAELECQNLERRERDALALVEQMADLQAISAKESARFESNVHLAVNALNSGALSSGVDEDSQPGSVEYARKSAFSAAAFVDPDGKFSDHKSGDGFLQRLEDSVLRPYCGSNPGSPSVRPREENLSPAPVLSLPQRLALSRATRESEIPNNSRSGTSPVKRASNFQQINKRVVSGLYIDSLRSESPKKSLVEKIPRFPSSGASVVSPDRAVKFERSYSQPIMNHNSPHSPYSSGRTPPSRPPPPSPSLASASNMKSRTPNRPGNMEPSGKSGGGSRGPQFYRDLLLASKDKSFQTQTSPPSERYKERTTTESYLFSPSFQPDQRKYSTDARNRVPDWE